MSKPITHKHVFQAMEAWAPLHLAYDWDNVGLQIGSPLRTAKKVMVTLDVLENIVDEAIEENVDLIISHHPLFFKAIKDINTGTPQGRVIKKLIKHDISVYTAHTNLDIADGGVNDILCDLLHVNQRKPLLPLSTENLYKLVVYVPLTHQEEVRDALSDAGAGHIGNYSHCTFQAEGKGTFKPLEGSQPYSGKVNETAFVDEVRMETIVREKNVQHSIEYMKKAHPYEEVAYDLYKLENKGHTLGLGRIGKIESSMTLKNFVEEVKSAFNISNVRVVGNLDKPIKEVAVLGGSGEKYIDIAKQAGADVYVTGDLTFHTAQDAKEAGLCVIDPGHHIEEAMKEATKDYLDKHFHQELDVIVAKADSEPFQFV